MTRRPPGIGEVLDGGFRLFQASLLRCVPYAALAAVAGQLPAAYDLAAGHPLRGFATTDPLWWSLYLAATCISFIMWSAVLLHQRRIERGERLGPVAEVGDACRRLPSILGLVAPLALATALALRLGPTLRLLLLPALYLATALAMSWPALLLERKGPLAAFRRGLALVAGKWWRTAVLLAASALIVIVIYALGGVLGAFAALPSAWLKGVVLLLLASLTVPLFSALLLAVYSDLNSPRSPRT